MVSARQEEDEKIKALDAGADDYVTKPFYMGELQARIRVALRKTQNNPVKNEIFQQDYLPVDIEKHQVLIDGQEIPLTPIEFKILILLIANRGKVPVSYTHLDVYKRQSGGCPCGCRPGQYYPESLPGGNESYFFQFPAVYHGLKCGT